MELSHVNSNEKVDGNQLKSLKRKQPLDDEAAAQKRVRSETNSISGTSTNHEKRNKVDKFRYGNFDRYYGTRLSGQSRDPRLEVLKKDWFQGKSVLDIGCNAGYLTLSLAKEFEPSRILGIDIDDHLIGVARKNIRHYCDGNVELIGKLPAVLVKNKETNEPTTSTGFPSNVWFRKENYVLESDEFLEMVNPEFDTILALSISKWIHLNWGDEGMKRFFKRAFHHLRPNGRFILESQPYSSYRKRSKINDILRENYRSIKFFPEQFREYLLTKEIGFSTCEELRVPNASSKGM
uniref:RNA methyltransferase n=1 Tax=Acrobeloides nanus TaxID=290746 RepID=A0A914BXI3_9BILA